MPLLGIAISHHSCCFHSKNLSSWPAIRIHNKTVVGNDGGLGLASAYSWKASCVTEKLGKTFNGGRVDAWPSGQIIRAAASLGIGSDTFKNKGVKGSVLREDNNSVKPSSSMAELQFSSDDSTGLDEGEKLRRMRISRSNKGMMPWNKGRKHSEATIQRIKERTRLAMQDPKVKMKMKLINLGNTQTEETKMKIGVGVRLGWERRRQKLKLQETCHHEWQNLISEAACKGLWSEEKLEWDSYETLNKQLKHEYLQSVKKRKNQPRTKGNKRAPKSAEQRRKISEAISVKWADPEYRDRVFSGLAKYHGISGRVGRKPDSDKHVQRRSPTKKDGITNLEKHKIMPQVQQVRLTKSKVPSYSDPLTNSKLDMIKNIRAQRAAVMNKKIEAVSRAKLLIAQAESATMALERAAQGSRCVQAALVESRTLIAKANEFLESIEKEPSGNGNHHSVCSTESVPKNAIKVDGVRGLSCKDNKVEDFWFSEFSLPNFANGRSPISCPGNLHKTKQAFRQLNHILDLYSADDRAKPVACGLGFQSENAEGPKEQGKIIKKWIRGRLVEVTEEA